MAIANLSDYKTRLNGVREPVALSLGALATVAGRSYDLWASHVPAGATPSAAVAPTRTTAGAIGVEPAGGGAQNSILAARFSATVPGNYIVVDRLSHSAGLSATVTTAQTTQLPTAAITRGSAEGVMMAITIYSQIGSTATTVTVSYTNSAGTPGRTSTAVVLGGTGFREVGRMIFLPLQDNDAGVESVQSVTVLATTGTAGNFGITLFRPLYVICVPDTSGVLPSAGLIAGSVFGGAPAIPTDACLSPIYIGGTTPMGAGALLVSEN